MNVWTGIAEFLTIIALWTVLQDNNMYVSEGVIVCVIIIFILRIIGRIIGGIDEAHRLQEIRDIMKKSDTRLEERFARVVSEMRLMQTRFGWTQNLNPPTYNKDIL